MRHPHNRGTATVLYGMTSGLSARGFIQGQAPYLRSRGWDVALVCSQAGDVREFAEEDGIDYYPIALERNPSLWQDLKGTVALMAAIRRIRPAVTVWGSPKASLLGVLASRVLGVPSVYVIHGLRLEGSAGLLRRILVAAERLTCLMASRVVADGHDLRALALRLRLVRPGKIVVLADGSSNGVGASDVAPRYRGKLDLAEDAVVVTFAGRITRDKGVRELASAWHEIAPSHPNAHLVIAGQADPSDPAGPAYAQALSRLPNTHLLGHIDDLDHLWADTDLMVLPSYREGLPLVVIEAAAAGVPGVVTSCTGGSEAVLDGQTGIVVPTRDVRALASALTTMLDDPDLRKRMGAAARRRSLARYDRQRLWAALEALLRETGGSPMGAGHGDAPR